MQNSRDKDNALAAGGVLQIGNAQRPDVREQPPLPGWQPEFWQPQATCSALLLAAAHLCSKRCLDKLN